jgi:hypothetical protein
MEARFTTDSDGQDMLVSPAGGQVMMQWERGYMEALVDNLNVTSGSTVLEVGFGLGFSATRIQRYRPAAHTIIEVCACVLHVEAWLSGPSRGPVRCVVVRRHSGLIRNLFWAPMPALVVRFRIFG